MTAPRYFLDLRFLGERTLDAEPGFLKSQDFSLGLFQQAESTSASNTVKKKDY